MTTILYTSIYGSNDPMAIQAFVSALGAVEASHHVQITLIGETTYLVR